MQITTRPLARLAGLSALALAATTLAAAPATADHGGPWLSDNEYICEELNGGIWERTDREMGHTATCTFTEEHSETRAGANPNNGFRVDVDVVETTVYVTDAEWGYVGAGERCFMSDGTVMSTVAWNPANPERGNPNCVSAYRQGGQQAEWPHYYIGHYDGQLIVISRDHTVSTTEDVTVTACYNRGGNLVRDWATNPNCVPAP